MNHAHKYWSSRTEEADGNQPNTYINASRSQHTEIHKTLQPYINEDSKILEIGCNVGRNLNHLYHQGYKNLTGIEINPNAIDVGKNHYRELYADSRVQIEIGSAEDFLSDNSNHYDAVFTLAVLQHMTTEERQFVLNWIATHTKCACFIEMRGDAATPTRWPANDGYFHNGVKDYSPLINKGFKIIDERVSSTLGGSYIRTLLA